MFNLGLDRLVVVANLGLDLRVVVAGRLVVAELNRDKKEIIKKGS